MTAAGIMPAVKSRGVPYLVAWDRFFIEGYREVGLHEQLQFAENELMQKDSRHLLNCNISHKKCHENTSNLVGRENFQTLILPVFTARENIKVTLV